MKKLAILFLTFTFILTAAPLDSIHAASKTTTNKAEPTTATPTTKKHEIVTTPEWIRDIVEKKPTVVKNPVTRAQLASLIVKATSQTASYTPQAFKDVTSTSPVNTAVALGFINPNDYANGFKENTPVTRYELATWLCNGLAKADPSFADALKDTAGKYAVLPLREFNLGKLDKKMHPAISVVMGTGLMSADEKGEGESHLWSKNRVHEEILFNITVFANNDNPTHQTTWFFHPKASNISKYHVLSPE